MDDRRIRRTKARIRDSFTELLEQKDIKDITVKELCERSDINRGTFYYHYEDLFDLQRSIEDELLDEAGDLIRKHLPNHKDDTLRYFFVLILRFIADNSATIRMLFRKSPTFLTQITHRMLYDWNIGELIRFNHPSDDLTELMYIGRFLISGYIAVLSYWLETDMLEPLDYVAGLMLKLSQTSLMGLINEG